MAVFVGILCVFEIIEYPSWHKHGTLDWTYQTAYARLSASVRVVHTSVGRRA